MKAPDKVNAGLMKIREEAIQSRKQLDTLIFTIDNYINHHDTDDMVIYLRNKGTGCTTIADLTGLSVGTVMNKIRKYEVSGEIEKIQRGRIKRCQEDKGTSEI